MPKPNTDPLLEPQHKRTPDKTRERSEQSPHVGGAIPAAPHPSTMGVRQSMAPSRKIPSDSRRGSQSILARKSILIVEDEPLVALDLHATLSTVGASLISAATSGEAIKLIGYADVSAAIVDVQLGREDATQVCNVLEQRRIPFVFYTGRAAETVLLAAWSTIPILKKPAKPQVIISALEALLVPLSDH